ncbi:polysaccharide pyruvyl transferase family protein, partial [Nocardioides sp. P5_C9_2]
MPISCELSTGRTGRIFAALTSAVQLTARDSRSQERFKALGLASRVAPDLAFLNASSNPSSKASEALFVSVVGTDYLDDKEMGSVVANLSRAISAFPRGTSVGLVAMHATLGGTHVGADVGALVRLEEALELKGFHTFYVEVQTYGELCRALAGGRGLIAARMHAGIAGMCAGIPVALLAYEEKHFALAQDRGLSQYCISI